MTNVEKAADHYQRQNRLAEIALRLDAIIPGPWRWYGNTATDQVFLATTDRGRLIILMPGTRTTEYVYDHDASESYELSDAYRRVHELWCPRHAHDVDRDDPGSCYCDALRDFLRPRDNPEELGYSEMEIADRGYRRSLTRGSTVHADLRFPVRIPAPKGERDRKRLGGIMRSYRDCGVKYEVLGYRTVTEWEMDQGGVVPSADGDIKNFLYREDFTGIEQPEAEFIERAPEDMAFLLAEVGRLQAENEKLPR